MIYEFYNFEKFNINNKITELTLNKEEYIYIPTHDRVIFVVDPTTLQKAVATMYKFLDWVLFSIIMILFYMLYRINNIMFTSVVVVCYFLIGIGYKFNTDILSYTLRKIDWQK